MKTMALMCFVFMLMFGAGCAAPQKALSPGQHSQSLDRQIAVKINYLLYLPEGYGRGEEKWPLILFLHGVDERGDDLEDVKLLGPPKIVEEGKNLPFIIVSPQCSRNQWWPQKIEVLMGLLDEIEEKYAVDSERIYLTGLSMGGFGTWSLACMYPDRFAAIAPVCGGGQPYIARNLKNVPVWAFHGAIDRIVPLKRSEEMVKAVKAAGGNAKLTVYPDADHDSWTETYNNPKLYDWFLEHRRKSKAK